MMGLLFLWLFQQTLTGTVTVTMQANDPTVAGQTTSGLATVQCLLDGQPLGPQFTAPPFSFSWNTALYANGGHTLTARATDNAGNVGTAVLAVNIANSAPDTTPPVINFVTPIAGSTVSGKINVMATATDNTSVAGMTLYIQGQQKATSGNGSLSYNWNTAPYKKQTVPLVISARDPNGNTASSSVTVNVK